MIFESQKMRLSTVVTKFCNENNDCYVCRDLNSSNGSLYTVIIVHQHDIVKNILEVFRVADKEAKNECLIDSFTVFGGHCLVFPYRKERPLSDFYAGDAYKLSVCEDICISTILSCISSKIPYPLLYLILSQGELNLTSENTVYLSYAVDMSELDAARGEKECTVECAKILLKLLESKADQKAISYQLLEKKVGNKSYDRFTDLYRDITIAAVGGRKSSIFTKIKAWFRNNSDRIFGVLFWICLMLGIFALSILLSRLILGNGSWLRLLFNNFKIIGTENLAK
ncbi:MAG: hypothetical protein K6F99_04010 [Lachnospiraceae bacterium]|nr:hypothetical protein [Lachnospiraceae bacterium]